MAPVFSTRLAVEDAVLRVLSVCAPEPVRRQLLSRAVAATDIRAVALLSTRLGPNAALLEALRLRPLHKLNTLFMQVAAGIGPSAEHVEPLQRGSKAWLRAADRGRLEGRTFVPEPRWSELRAAMSSDRPPEGRRLAELLVAPPEAVARRWQAWQLEISAALLAGSGTEDLEALADARGRRPLHYAAACGNVALLELLIHRGADINAQDDCGRTAQHIAALYAQPRTFDVLEAFAAQGRPQDLMGFTAPGLVDAQASVLRCAPAPVQTPPAADGWRLAPEVTLEMPVAAAETWGPQLAVASGRWGPGARALLAKAMLLQRPMLLQGAAADLPASATWTRAGLLQRYGSLELRTTAWWPWATAKATKPTLRDFVEDVMQAPPGVAAPYAFEDVPLFPAVSSQSGLQVRAPQLAVGPAGSGAPLHAHAAALNALIVGVKRWQLVPPPEVTWSLTPPRFDGHPQDRPKFIQVDQRAGDLLYVPEHWGHSTLLLSDCVAATYEFTASTSLWS